MNKVVNFKYFFSDKFVLLLEVLKIDRKKRGIINGINP